MGKWHLGHARREFLPLAHGFTAYYGHYNGAIDYFKHTREGENDWHRDDRSVREEGYSTDLLGAEAARFIREAPAGKPWFLYLPFNAPARALPGQGGGLARNIHSSNCRSAELMRPWWIVWTRRLAGCWRRCSPRPEATNTLVLFFSDNGGVLKAGSSNRPWRGGKLSVYEGGTRVCAAIWWPAGGLTGGGHFAGRIGYIDVLPTLLAAAGERSCRATWMGLTFCPPCMANL